MKKHCLNCNKTFIPTKGNLAKGYGKYCSRACRNTGAGLGFKNGHGSFWTAESRQKFRASMLAEKHFAWIANNPSYHTLHRWVAQNKGRPKKCEFCGSEGRKFYDWANVDHKYQRNLDDFIRLCRPCHRKYDYEKNLVQDSRALVNV